MILDDKQFFNAYPDRQARIRMPTPYNEEHRAFNSLGDHPYHRRRILLYRVPPDNIHYNPKKQMILNIPFLAFADETIEDRDDILLPIIRTIMAEQLETSGRA